jgi:hypothetical protein
MSIRTSPWPTGTPCWADISVADPDAARAFYAAVLGWSFREPGPDDGGYTIATVGDHPVGGVGPQQTPEQPALWMLYLATDDVDATAAAISDNGGTVFMAPGDVGPYGRMAVAADPTGALFAVWQAKDHIGAGLVNEPGGMTWEDLRSTDPAAAHTFYSAVFGVQTRPIEMAPEDYRTFHLPGSDAPLGGIGGFMGPAGPSHWAVYFGVANVDDAAAAAARSGGTVVQPTFETPYGRMAGVIDPAGAFFQLVESTGSGT